MKPRSGRINRALLWIYLFAVAAITCFLHGDKLTAALRLERLTGLNVRPVFLYILLAGALLCVAVPLLDRLVAGMRIAPAPAADARQKQACFILCAGVTFAVLLAYYLAFFPGGFSADSLEQLGQAMSGHYNDWHPVWHTLLSFTLPLKLTGGRVKAILLFQIVYYALAFGYMGMTVFELAGVGAAAAAMAYMLLNPSVTQLALWAWKDALFSVVTMLAMTCALRVYFSRGQWCERRGRTAMLAFWLANATLFRHNGVLFSGTMLLALLFLMNRRRWLRLAALTLAFVALVKGPLYACLQVEQPGSRTVETTGLPMTVIANAVKESPEKLDDETAAFAEALAPREVWESCVLGDFNSIKWQVDWDVIEQTGAAGIVRMMLRCMRSAPEASMRALLMLTEQVYKIGGFDNRYQPPEIMPWHRTNLGIGTAQALPLQRLLRGYQKLVEKTPLHLAFGFVGFANLMVIAAALCRSDLSRASDWKRIALCLPMLAYNFGTMLLLTGKDLRFFSFSFLVAPLAVLLMLREQKTDLDDIEGYAR